MKQNNTNKTTPTPIYIIMKITFAMLLFFALRFILTEAYALILSNTITSNETLYILFTIGSLILTVFIALPIFCLAMHFPIRTISTLFQSQKKETYPIVPFLLVGFAAVSFVVLIECGLVYWNILGLTALKTGDIRFSIILHIVLNFYGAVAVPLLLQIGTVLPTVILSLIFIILGGLILKKGIFNLITS